MTDTSPHIVWFRDDLRLSDHPALHAASTSGAPVICLYVFDEASPALKPNARPIGGATRWWLAQSLRALEASLKRIGGTLVLRRGAAADVIAAVARETDASHVHWNEIAQAPHLAVADQVVEALADLNVGAHSYPGDLLVSPNGIRTKEGRGLRVFTPFWKRILAMGDPAKPLNAPKKLKPAPSIASDKLSDWKLEPTTPDWAGGLREMWTPGEAAAQKRLDLLLKGGVAGYATDPIAKARRGCRRTCASANSARARSGMRHALLPPNVRSTPPTSTNSSARWAGASSAGTCCSTSRTSPTAICKARSTTFRGVATPARCAPGNAARPAIRSSMPACASSGTPARCTIASAWWWLPSS